jgi:hypothetical protein
VVEPFRGQDDMKHRENVCGRDKQARDPPSAAEDGSQEWIVVEGRGFNGGHDADLPSQLLLVTSPLIILFLFWSPTHMQ